MPYPSSSLIVNSLSLFLQKCWMFLIVLNTFECVPMRSELKKDERVKQKKEEEKRDAKNLTCMCVWKNKQSLDLVKR